MAHLVEQLGVNRSSLYATYHNKEDLFRRALLHYDRTQRQDRFEDMSVRLEPLEAVRHAFVEMVGAPEPSRRFGCLLVNTTLDLPCEEPVGDIVRAAFDATERFFEGQLELAKAGGQLAADSDTGSLAATLVAMFVGLRVLARAQRPAESSVPILRQVDAMLQPAR